MSLALMIPGVGMGAGAAFTWSPTTNDSTIFLYTANNWVNVANWYYEATVNPTVGTIKSRLYDITDAGAVTDSTVTSTGTTKQRLRSSAITLTDGNEYEAQFGKAPADSGKVGGAKLIAI